MTITVDEGQIDVKQLPQTPGVYLFYTDLKQLPIYIGKSINIRKRVQSHYQLAKHGRKERRLMHKVKHIDWQLTIGEIGALLLESKLVKQKLPIHNRRLRKQHLLYSFELLNSAGFYQPNLVTHKVDAIELQDNCYGLFRSQRQALEFLEKITTELQLCRKRLGLEKTTRACFAKQLNKCRGACIDLETAQQHNQRLLAALTAYEQKAWPYAGAIAIHESSADNKQHAYHVLNKWHYFGSAPDLTQANALLNDGAKKQTFDIDAYKIFLQTLKKANITNNVVLL